MYFRLLKLITDIDWIQLMNGSYDWWNQILIDEIKYCFLECGFVGNRVDAGRKRAWHAVCSLGFSAKLDVSCGEGVPSTLFEYVVFIVVLIFIIFAFFIYQIFVKIWSLVKLGALVEIGPCWLSADRWKNKLIFMGDKWLKKELSYLRFQTGSRFGFVSFFFLF